MPRKRVRRFPFEGEIVKEPDSSPGLECTVLFPRCATTRRWSALPPLSLCKMASFFTPRTLCAFLYRIFSNLSPPRIIICRSNLSPRRSRAKVLSVQVLGYSDRKYHHHLRCPTLISTSSKNRERHSENCSPMGAGEFTPDLLYAPIDCFGNGRTMSSSQVCSDLPAVTVSEVVKSVASPQKDLLCKSRQENYYIPNPSSLAGEALSCND